MKQSIHPQATLAPIPTVLVTSGNMEKSNILTIAWTGIINSEPPMLYISIRQTRYSYSLIKENMEFVVNLPDEKLVRETDFCGTKSGKEIDKFKEANLTKEAAKIVKPPLIKECPVNIECKVKEIKNLGSHDMFIADIVNINIEEELINNGKINLAKANLLGYFGSEYYIANKKVGDRGICLK